MKLQGVLTIAAGLALALPLAFYAQAPATITPREKAGDAIPRPDVRIDSSVVLIPVAVNDELGRPVAGLEMEHFAITDNKVPQKITSFAMDEAPIALGLVFDVSGSMGSTLPQARRAANLFFRTANDGDEFLLVEFDSRPRITVPLTRDIAHINYQLLFNKAGGSTALIDGVYMAMHEVKKSENTRKALVVVSDGLDNNSRYSQGELKTVLRESDVLVYSVMVGSGAYGYGDSYLLRRIAEETGGRMYASGSGLGDIAQKITIDLRNRYVIGYTPTDTSRDGKYHKVELTLKPPRGLPKLTSYWRRGYYAPEE
jgi:VWFA-related protein